MRKKCEFQKGSHALLVHLKCLPQAGKKLMQLENNLKSTDHKESKM